MPEDDELLIELKFRLSDGSDIGPFRYPSSSSISLLKDTILAHWPKDIKLSPKSANDIKIVSGGKILENSTTVGQCRMPFDDELEKAVITMHVVVQPSLTKSKTEKKIDESKKKTLCSCSCSIL